MGWDLLVEGLGGIVGVEGIEVGGELCGFLVVDGGWFNDRKVGLLLGGGSRLVRSFGGRF